MKRSLPPPGTWQGRSPGPAATRALGAALGSRAFPGLVISLEGELGVGKTAFVQGFARGMGVPRGTGIVSPTFSIVNPYEGRLPLYHLDLYRISDASELDVLGFRDLLSPHAVTLVEWGNLFPEVFPALYLRILLEHRTPRTRRITVELGRATAEANLAERCREAELVRWLWQADTQTLFPPATKR